VLVAAVARVARVLVAPVARVAGMPAAAVARIVGVLVAAVDRVVGASWRRRWWLGRWRLAALMARAVADGRRRAAAASQRIRTPL
jgi:hypothetical protein